MLDHPRTAALRRHSSILTEEIVPAHVAWARKLARSLKGGGLPAGRTPKPRFGSLATGVGASSLSRSARWAIGCGLGAAALFLFLALASPSKPPLNAPRVTAAGLTPPKLGRAPSTEVKVEQQTSMLQRLKENAKHEKEKRKKRH
jgi:hypothetical protein